VRSRLTEEVDGERSDVGLVLQRRPAFQELLFHGAAEAQHLLGVRSDLLQCVDDLLLRTKGAMKSRIIAF
jgi:hypothetical protein